MIHTIIIESVGGRFSAHIRGRESLRAGGETMNEAITTLVTTQANALNLQFEFPSSNVQVIQKGGPIIGETFPEPGELSFTR